MRFASWLLVATLPLAGCVIDLGDDDDTPPCYYAADVWVDTLVNPATLQCESFGGGCPDACGPCALADIAYPSWGSCSSACIGLDEHACATTTGCRTTYDYNCLFTDGPCPQLTPFLGCYPTDTSGPVQGACVGLEAWECSRHDDCLAAYRLDPAGNRSFATCAPELLFECPPNADCG